MDDRTAVIDTVTRYATALDSRDWALLDEVFTPDAVGDFGAGPLAGREALRGLVRRMLGGSGPSQHLLANHRVEVDGDTARCVCQVRAFSAGVGPAAGRSYELLGEYRDRLVRTPEGWRIARRELKVHHERGSREVLGLETTGAGKAGAAG
jgi:3-phenylpropionate/cinnamic acid dioxygenase small subunit